MATRSCSRPPDNCTRHACPHPHESCEDQWSPQSEVPDDSTNSQTQCSLSSRPSHAPSLARAQPSSMPAALLSERIRTPGRRGELGIPVRRGPDQVADIPTPASSHSAPDPLLHGPIASSKPGGCARLGHVATVGCYTDLGAALESVSGALHARKQNYCVRIHAPPLCPRHPAMFDVFPSPFPSPSFYPCAAALSAPTPCSTIAKKVLRGSPLLLTLHGELFGPLQNSTSASSGRPSVESTTRT
mmetsp:Transcript_32803/g.76588  ORF Transcript_32803/g.76588 Transcript_32803/m.76588 type:complete len:244 (+) Transcript_32803:133-864(+)